MYLTITNVVFTPTLHLHAAHHDLEEVLPDLPRGKARPAAARRTGRHQVVIDRRHQ
jgi:hypothetical protein